MKITKLDNPNRMSKWSELYALLDKTKTGECVEIESNGSDPRHMRKILTNTCKNRYGVGKIGTRVRGNKILVFKK